MSPEAVCHSKNILLFADEMFYNVESDWKDTRRLVHAEAAGANEGKGKILLSENELNETL